MLKCSTILSADRISHISLPCFRVGENTAQRVQKDLTLRQTVAELTAVDVTARKQTIEINKGKLVYTLVNSTLASGASALDLLRRVPGGSIHITVYCVTKMRQF